MIIADKILYLRKKHNFSQEELAEKLGVSRQSISKWEGALSIPDISKIMAISQLFGVSTDCLLKDEIENLEYVGGEERCGKLVSLEDAKNFIRAYEDSSKQKAMALCCFIMSSTPLIVLQALSENKFMNENTSQAVGLILFFLLVATGFGLKIMNPKLDAFNYVSEGEFELGFGVRSVIKEERDKFVFIHKKFKTLAMVLFIMSVVPVSVAQLFDAGIFTTYMLSVVLLGMIATGLAILVINSGRKKAYKALLEGKECTNLKCEGKKLL